MGYLLIAVPGRLIGRVGSAAALINIGAASLTPLVVGSLLPSWGRDGVCRLGLAVLSAAVLVNRSLRAIPRPEDLKEYAVSRVSREAHPRREPSETTTS